MEEVWSKADHGGDWWHFMMTRFPHLPHIRNHYDMASVQSFMPLTLLCWLFVAVLQMTTFSFRCGRKWWREMTVRAAGCQGTEVAWVL